MNGFAARIERDFSVRRKEKQKTEFRAWLVYTLKEMGYSPKLESGEYSLSLGGTMTSVVAGDPEKAKIVLAAHYDTGVREILPPMISPTRPVSFILYQALFPILVLAGSFALSLALTFPFDLPALTLPLFLVLLAAALFYPKYGPDERATLNDNTSGIVTLLEVARTLTPRYRGEVCFLFLDGGTQAAKGAKGLRRAHPCLKEKPVMVVDCVAEGDELLLLPGRAGRWNGALLDAINDNFSNSEKKTCFLKTDGLITFPSDNRAFAHSVSICACRKIPGFGRCILPRRAKEIDEENLAILREGLSKLIMNYQPESRT